MKILSGTGRGKKLFYRYRQGSEIDSINEQVNYLNEIEIQFNVVYEWISSLGNNDLFSFFSGNSEFISDGFESPVIQDDQEPAGAGGTQVIRFGEEITLLFHTNPNTLFITDNGYGIDSKSNMIGVSGTMEKFVIDANQVLLDSHILGVDRKLVITLQKNEQDTSISCTIMQLEPVICSSEVQISVLETDSLRVKFESQAIGNTLSSVNFSFKGFALIRE